MQGHLLQLLSEFTAALHRNDPMQLKSDNPSEYDKEALTILSRFVENGIHRASALDALHIVVQAFKYWFCDENDLSPEELASIAEASNDLYDIFRKKYVIVDEVLG